jgi:hypothetical protein
VRIAGLVFTDHLPAAAMPWMAEARGIFDELVVVIHEKQATPGTQLRARKVASRVLQNKADAWYEADVLAVVAECKTEWVFHLDYDEQLGREWHDGQWRQILENDGFTHFSFPRRWVVPGDRYIIVGPWWPDVHTRLIRANLDGLVLPKRLHDTPQVAGAGGCLPGLPINHHVLHLLSRAEREEKKRRYEQLRPGGALGYYYLFEDYAAPQASLPAPAALDISREIIRMETLFPEEVSKISLEVTGVPQEVGVSAMFWVRARVTNGLDRALYPVPPYPVRLVYHWLEKSTRKTIVFEGIRTGLFPGLEAKAAEQYDMTILAPEQPGEYILQTTMVQDGVYWFENIRPDIVQEFEVSVI